MLSSSMLLLNLILPIEVTFSTPTPDFTNYGPNRGCECNLFSTVIYVDSHEYPQSCHFY
jgi:hypothetical protein